MHVPRLPGRVDSLGAARSWDRVAGMDEAGRGSWAGPVVAAAVIIPNGTWLGGLNDSKKLTPFFREKLYKKIISSCFYGIGCASQDEVDRYGLLPATFFAFNRALQNLPAKADHLLIDGRDRFSFAIPHTSIIRGDQRHRCIMAASVVAKVTRDRLMIEYGKEYPEYRFQEHKGYGTQFHQKALEKLGPCKLHRQSYEPLKRLKWVQETFL